MNFIKYLLETRSKRNVADFICNDLHKCKLNESDDTFDLCESYKSVVSKIQPTYRDFYKATNLTVDIEFFLQRNIETIDDVEFFFRNYVTLCAKLNTHGDKLTLKLSKLKTVDTNTHLEIKRFNELAEILNKMSIKTKEILDHTEKLNCVKRINLHSTIVNFINKTPVVLPINYHIDFVNSIENFKINTTDKS